MAERGFFRTLEARQNAQRSKNWIITQNKTCNRNVLTLDCKAQRAVIVSKNIIRFNLLIRKGYATSFSLFNY